MKSRFRYAATLLTAAILTAGCGTNSGPNAMSNLAQGQNRTGGHPLVFVSTTVKFKNNGSSTISGSGSSTCWSISPSLPNVTSGSVSATITLGYDTTCINGPNHLDISYGPSGGPACTFVTTYSSGAFSYAADNTASTACTATPSGNPTFDELYTYAPAGGLRRHR